MIRKYHILKDRKTAVAIVPLLLESDSKQSKSADMSMHCLVRLTWRFIRALRTKVEGICSLSCQSCVYRHTYYHILISVLQHFILQTSSFSLECHVFLLVKTHENVSVKKLLFITQLLNNKSTNCLKVWQVQKCLENLTKSIHFPMNLKWYHQSPHFRLCEDCHHLNTLKVGLTYK